ncbi:MAG: peptidylprolyl isomerase [Gammaproteobacteria bacterium]|nr:peptidylprolyl isomerase [Gammaproteobacteria bacterium]MDH5800983.1 peptidylprolyl isomerase [Gammaproteobacteria bacterium]
MSLPALKQHAVVVKLPVLLLAMLYCIVASVSPQAVEYDKALSIEKQNDQSTSAKSTNSQSTNSQSTNSQSLNAQSASPGDQNAAKTTSQTVLTQWQETGVADPQNPKVSNQYIVLSTNYGPLLLALYPDVAPQHVTHILNMVRAGMYDTTDFFRIEPGFLIQLSQVESRSTPLSVSQRQLIKQIPGEFSQIKHRKGKLTMARWDNNVNSASSSFCIMLGDAPHLDGAYTIFGHLESGGSVVNKMLGGRIDDQNRPKKRIQVDRAYVLTDLVAHYAKYPFDPPEKIGDQNEIAAATQALKAANPLDYSLENPLISLIAILAVVMIAVGVLGFFLFKRISKNRLLSLLLVNVLISSFILLLIFVPVGHDNSWVAALLFMAAFGLFQLMSRFEKNN